MTYDIFPAWETHVTFSHFRLESEHIVGSNKNLELQVSVSNKGEDAFEAKFHLRLEQNLRFVKLKEEEEEIEYEEEEEEKVRYSPFSNFKNYYQLNVVHY